MTVLKSIDWKRLGKDYLLVLTILIVFHGAITPLFRPEAAFTLNASLFTPAVMVASFMRVDKEKAVFKGCLTAFVFVFLLRLLLGWLLADIERVPLSPLTYWGICLGVAILTALVWQPWKLLTEVSGPGKHDRRE